MPSSHLHAFIDQFDGLDPVNLDPQEVLAALAGLPDPRARRGVRHSFAHLLVIMVFSMVAGAKTLVEMAEWASDTARTELAAHGIGAPHATTLARVLGRLDAAAMDLLVSDWAQRIGSPVAIVCGRQGNARRQEWRRGTGPPHGGHRPGFQRGAGTGFGGRKDQ